MNQAKRSVRESARTDRRAPGVRRAVVAASTGALVGVALVLVGALAVVRAEADDQPAGAKAGQPPSAESSTAAAAYPEVVVLVSGYVSDTPYTTPDPSCYGTEGETWGNVGGVAQALKDAGLIVFTAPVRSNQAGLPDPCTADASIQPANDAVIDSDGPTGENGKALARFIEFLHDEFGTERIQLVGHSDGGLWSRAAITRSKRYRGDVEIRSLTTLGTPHIGSWVADLLIDTLELRCGTLGALESECKTLFSAVKQQVVTLVGGAASRQLTSAYLESWNARQRIGACPATGVAGTAITGEPIDGMFANPSTFVTPFDGVVGEASALNRVSSDLYGFKLADAGIPNWTPSGTFDVGHSLSVTLIDDVKAVLTNTQAVSDRIVELVESVPEGGALCTKKRSGERRNGKAVLNQPLFQLAGQGADGRLPAPDPDDPILVKSGLEARCGGAELALGGLPEVSGPGTSVNVEIGFSQGCNEQVRILNPDGSPAAAGSALLIRTHPKNTAKVVVRNAQLKVKIRGPKVKGLKVQVRSKRKWEKLDLNEKGNAKLPGTARDLQLVRISAKTRPDFDRSTAELPIAR